MSSNTSLALLVASCAIFSSPSWAQQLRPNPLLETCQSDIATLCGPDDAKGSTAFRCLNDHQGQLGTECALAFKTAQERRQRIRAACQPDATKLCAGQEEKGGALGACLRAKVGELSNECRDALAPTQLPTKN